VAGESASTGHPRVDYALSAFKIAGSSQAAQNRMQHLRKAIGAFGKDRRRSLVRSTDVVVTFKRLTFSKTYKRIFRRCFLNMVANTYWLSNRAANLQVPTQAIPKLFAPGVCWRMAPLNSSGTALITVMDFSGNDTHSYYGYARQQSSGQRRS